MLNLYNTLKRARSIQVAMATINRPVKLQCIKEAAVEEPTPASKYVKPLDRISAAERTPTSPKATAAPARRQQQSSPRKDALKPGNPACELYFLIRRSCTGENAVIFDDVETLRKLLPTREIKGRDFAVWPRQHLLLHGLSKAGCNKCVTYLVKDLGFDVNYRRTTDRCTALHMAHFHLQGMELQTMRKTLLALNAKPGMKNKWGELPSDLVAKPGICDPSPKMSPATPQQSPCGIADLWLEAPTLDALDLGPSAKASKTVVLTKTLSALPASSAKSACFVPKGDSAYRSYCYGMEAALECRDPRACAWTPAERDEAAIRKQGTPAGDLYAAVRQAAGAVLPSHAAVPASA